MNKRDKLLKIVEALSKKTTENGCTEGEALVAAKKLEVIMVKYGLTLEELQAIESTQECEQSDVFAESRTNAFFFVAGSVARFTDTRIWYRKTAGAPYAITFFGLPGDVRIAIHLATIIKEAMDQEWTFYWAVNYGRTEVREPVAKENFLIGMASRIRDRLDLMKKEREGRNNNCKAIVLQKSSIIDQAIKAAGIQLDTKGSRRGVLNFDDNSYSAGMSAGLRAHLNSGEIEAA